ncbi:hypothetical protein ABEX69_05355 [Bacillus safensis]|uniref:hypothetical protein n=1 Tax=Bacillus safensis TaxID=561879 RepID=UPI0022375ADD|nr:hypothetical protein [Bacillus safensis]MCW4645294.1 hypothetical protein [Bacillus safensis]MCY7566287.1 hypothetical protein [Bacillus safensis]MCY7624584.1 hypothetical protein [Bacillus safensis]MCY7631649.1 hypothetical protein [Bacillus safensis]MCY7647928.1 hypothetical protein [Bacillus safensis]
MEKVDSGLISIFQSSYSAPELMQSMRDISTLSGVLSDLDAQHFFQTPGEILRLLKIIQLLNEEALGLSDLIENTESIYYRYRNRYDDKEPPSQKRVDQVIQVLVKYNWISKQTRRIKMRDVGKRMMDMLIRLANDSLAYYKNDEIGRSLFQARRDSDISEAYDDQGISGGNKIASMIRNVENAITLLKERELEMLADRHALPQLELIHELMNDLDVKLEERFKKFQTVEDSLVLTELMQRGTEVLTTGTNLSLGMIKKYLKFTNMQNTPFSSHIQPEKIRRFISSMFEPPLESEVPDIYQLLSFMEQNQYNDEAVDGLWIPVKFASPLTSDTIEVAVDYLENYEPIIDSIPEEEEDIVYANEEVSGVDLERHIAESNWHLTKEMIDTTKIEAYFEKQEQATLEQVVIEATTEQWSDAINALTAISALVSNKEIVISKGTKLMGQKQYEKEWEWMNDEDGKDIVKRKRDNDHQRKSK